MKRRAFLSVATAGVAAAALLVALPQRAIDRARRRFNRFLPPPTDEEVAAALGDAFHYLQLAEDAAGKFVADYRRYCKTPIELPLRNHIKRTFLLSTDFVQQGADESRPVRYVVIYSPYDQPCYNPFTLLRWERGQS